MSYITIDGESYFSPCSNCFDKNCWSCILTKYEKDIKIKESELSSANFKIRTELEPRIKTERNSYDRWVSEDTGAQACESFSGLIDDLIDFVEEADKYMDWEDSHGGLEEKILFLIKNREDDDLWYIEEKG